MITDLQQSAKNWLADAFENFAQLMREGEDPSFTITCGPAVIEVRLQSLEGHFERRAVTIKNGKAEGGVKS